MENGRLRSPSSLPELATLEISPEYLEKTHFRQPPRVEYGPDGIPRYRGEADEPDIGAVRTPTAANRRFEPYNTGPPSTKKGKRSRSSRPDSQGSESGAYPDSYGYPQYPGYPYGNGYPYMQYPVGSPTEGSPTGQPGYYPYVNYHWPAGYPPGPPPISDSPEDAEEKDSKQEEQSP